MNDLLNDKVHVSTKTCHHRPSNVWFDDKCRRAKQSLNVDHFTLLQRLKKSHGINGVV